MINEDRIVQVSAIDLLSLYGLILKQVNTTLAALDAEDTEGDFSVTDGSAPLLASEPVKSIDIDSGVTAATVFFVPAYNFEGFSLAGVMTAHTGTVDPDGRTLYKAVLASGAITVTKAGF
jgi:hypothetical protein